MEYTGTEDILIRFLDGPWEGTRTIKGMWPPPPEFIVKGHLGRYALERESQLPAPHSVRPPGPKVLLLRGAEYRWEPAEVDQA